jgi:sec-independent protein translocase protein TatB
MFEVGFSELLLIMGLALLVLGPEKLPKVVSQIGRWMGRARAMARQFREQLEDETAEINRQRSTMPPTPAAMTTPDAVAPASSESSIAPPADPNNASSSNDPRT